MRKKTGHKIALLGGSFDPLHFGHLKVARAGLTIANEVWLLPCGQHPFFKEISATNHRLAMTKLQNEFPVCEIEINSKNPSYTIDTLEKLSLMYPHIDFLWLMGSDQVSNFSKWHRYHDILNKYQVYVYPREGFEKIKLLKRMKWLDQAPILKYSSTEIRTMINNQLNCSEFLPKEVLNYININSLYK